MQPPVATRGRLHSGQAQGRAVGKAEAMTSTGRDA